MDHRERPDIDREAAADPGPAERTPQGGLLRLELGLHRARLGDLIAGALLAAGLGLGLGGCGSSGPPTPALTRPAVGPTGVGPATAATPPPHTPRLGSTAPDGNPVPTRQDLQLPASGTIGIPASPAPPGGPVGCAAGGPIYNEHGPARRRVVALTFDDGPSGFTPEILAILERKRVRATFFVIGSQVAAHPELLRRALGDGDIVGDHTWTHADMSQLKPAVQRRQLALTAEAIRQATGFATCVWRSPYGAIDGHIEGLARSLGLISVQWDTDPQDFTMPPVAAIVARVLHGNRADPDPGAHPGAIVLMHDGGGDRSHTVAALPRLIDALRAQRYGFVTVTDLLGLAVARRR